jgi:hypothetical protein
MRLRHLLAFLAGLSLSVFSPLGGCSCTDDGSTAPPPPPPAAPTGLAVTGLTSGRVHLSWTDASSNETGFTIERSLDGGATWAVAGTVGVDVVAFVDRSRLPLQGVQYRVRPTNHATGWSNTVTDTTEDVVWGAGVGGGPSDRYGHTLIYDPLNQRLVLFGGNDPGGFLNDVWVLDLSAATVGAWAPLATTGGPPPPLYAHAAIYDAVNQRMIVFGGDLGTGPPYSSETWALTLPDESLPMPPTPTWSLLTTSGTAPTGRFGHTATYDSALGRMIIFAGHDGSATFLRDLRALDLATLAWSSLGQAGFGMFEHAAVYDTQGGRMLVFGGHDGTDLRGETWEATLPASGTAAWTLLATTGPPPRAYASAIGDEQNRRMILFGGGDAFAPLDDVWVLPLTPGAIWQQAAPASGPAARLDSAAAYDPVFERMLIFSGDDGSFFQIDDLAFPLDLGTP